MLFRSLIPLFDEAVYESIGIDHKQMLMELAGVFAKYEIPMGFVAKLLEITPYSEEYLTGLHSIQFLIDDSTSMALLLESEGIARFEETKRRLKQMIEILAHIPTPPIVISFLNRQDEVRLERGKRSPEEFLKEVYQKIDSCFFHEPEGSTPAKKGIADVLKEGSIERRALYLFFDGMPSGRVPEIKVIKRLLQNRGDPSGTPITFLPCSDDPEDVNWMLDMGKDIPCCTTIFDYEKEK